MMEFNVDELLQLIPELSLIYGTQVLLAVLVFFLGRWLVGMVTRVLEKGLNARGIDPTVSLFTKNILYYLLLIVVVVAALGQLGLQTASFVAVIGAAGLAIGLALQGSLSNFAAGVLLILFRPFKVGHYVEAGGAAGTVREISIFSTILQTPDNKIITVANASVWGNNITNYSAEPERRVDFTIGVSYSANLDQVRKELQAIAEADARVIQDREVTIGLIQMADSSINFAFRVWVKNGDYWGVFFDLNERIKKRFDETGIEIPFPQMDVHITKDQAND